MQGGLGSADKWCVQEGELVGTLCLYRHELSKLMETQLCAKHQVPTWPDPRALQENAI